MEPRRKRKRSPSPYSQSNTTSKRLKKDEQRQFSQSTRKRPVKSKHNFGEYDENYSLQNASDVKRPFKRSGLETSSGGSGGCDWMRPPSHSESKFNWQSSNSLQSQRTPSYNYREDLEPCSSLNTHQASVVTWPTGSDSYNAISPRLTDNREYLCGSVASNSFIDDRCDARELLNKRKQRSHEGLMTLDSPSKRQRHGHSKADLQRSSNSEKSEMDLLKHAINSNKTIDTKTTEKVLRLFNSKTDIQYELLVIFIQALCIGNVEKNAKLLFKSCVFWHHISILFCSMPQEKSKDKRNTFVRIIQDAIVLFGKLLETQPFESFKHLPIDSCCGAVEQLSQQDYMFRNVEEKVAQLKSQRDEIRQGLFNVEEREITHDDFALPTEEELHHPTLSLTLRKNIVKGSFASNSDYISIFYSLVREDFIHPLREARNNVGRNKQFIYENVTCEVVEVCSQEVKCRLKFKIKQNISWQYSKKLTYGSLLCLSHNNFATIFFATVSERDLDELKEQRIVVTLIGLAAQDTSYVSPSKVYRMFESPCYYEAYAPIIRTLYSLRENPSHLPFKEYFVSCTTDIKRPIYLEQNPDAKFSLHNVICSCKPEDCKHDSFCIEDIEKEELNNSSFVASDPSQAKAICTALTRNLVLIQGPPGTGKTYIGLKIVQSLLINKKLWNTSSKKPILLVCYTNHALDQFLEGLISIKDDLGSALQIRRVGGRSKSTIIEPYNIKKFINRMKRRQGITFTSKHSLRKRKSRIKHLSEFLEGTLPSSKEAIAAYSFFLSKAIVDEFKQYCHYTNMSLPTFSELASKTVEENPFHDRIESERHFSLDDDDQYSDIGPIFEEKSLKKFVCYFKKVRLLNLTDANEAFKQLAKDCFFDEYLHLKLFKYCLTKLQCEWQKELEHDTSENAHNEKCVEVIRVQCLQNADVVGLTITGAAKLNAALTQVKSKICIIEEAGEVMEPHVITSLTQHTQQLILIGDHKQLKPKTNCDEIGRKYKLNISLFERLVNNDFPVVTLKIQHRMRPEISRLVSKHIYDGCIEDSESVHKYDNVKGMVHNMFFINHHEYESHDEDESSPFNTHEATFVIYLCKYLILNGHKSDNITIITPYLGQLREIKEHSKLACVNVKVSTVDNFQGEENDIILLSLVRSNKEEDIGFTRFKNRVCVAMSRAKKGFYCIGNFCTFIKKSKLWQLIFSDLKEANLISDKLPLLCTTHSNITHVSNANDIENVLLKGCGKQCQVRLPACNHVCNRFCHPDDRAHKQDCTEPCPKRCDKNLHRCVAKCGLPCPPCKQLMEKTISKCGHKQDVPCNVPVNEFSCTNTCEKTLPCGHPCKLMCGQECSSVPCKFLVKKTWACGHCAQRECHESELNYSLVCSFPCNMTLVCGHNCSGKCGKCRQGRLHVPCKEKCTRILVCGHPCSEPCANNCKPCTSTCRFKCPHASCKHKCSSQCKLCPHRCEWKCEHFQCTRNCGEQCDRERCSKPCKKNLKCHHSCIGLCGEPCPPVCRKCNKESEVFEIYFGEEDNPDSRFIELNDCKCVIEATSLDTWIDTGSQDSNVSIKWKLCPKCSTPVISTPRYANEAKKVLADMNEIKHRESCVLSEHVRNEFYRTTVELSHLTYELLEKSQNRSTVTANIGKNLTGIFRARIKAFWNVGVIPNDILLIDFHNFFQSLHHALLTLNHIADIFSSKTMEKHEIKTNGIKWLNLQAKDFLTWLLECLNRRHFTDQVLKDLCAERKRLFLLGQLYYLKYRSMKCEDVKLSEHETTTLCSYKKYECFGCHSSISIDDDHFEQVSSEFNLIAKKFDPLSSTEKQMIIKAMGAKKGSWYKCQNGHFYQIGQCGGAMEKSKCPECLEVIGGEHHSLASGNQHAGEFDGSTHAAWSEGANLANYEGF